MISARPEQKLGTVSPSTIFCIGKRHPAGIAAVPSVFGKTHFLRRRFEGERRQRRAIAHEGLAPNQTFAIGIAGEQRAQGVPRKKGKHRPYGARAIDKLFSIDLVNNTWSSFRCGEFWSVPGLVVNSYKDLRTHAP